jgi:hypothetical protein
MIKQALESLLRSFRGHAAGFSAAVSGILADCITRFDHSITNDFTRIFPGGPSPAALQGMSGTQIRHLFQDRTVSGGPPGSQDLTAVTRCLQGSTVVVTLTDPSKHNLWIANLGDSQTGMHACLHVVQIVNASTRQPSRRRLLYLTFSQTLIYFSSSCVSCTRGPGGLVRNIRNRAP